MEIWKEVRGYEDYEVSNLGRVKSLARVITTVRGSRTYKDKILKPCLTGVKGAQYLAVDLSKGGKSKTRTIHQLVAEAFLNHTTCGHKLVIDHINNIKTDNRLENLQVVTNRKNTSKDKKGFTSEYTGVCWNKRDSKWYASIRINGKIKHLGVFADELEAAEAYVKALKEIS